jgi:hypothetical protein
MAKVKNTGGQARGFITEDGTHVTVAPGEEKEFNLTEVDFDHLKKLVESCDDPKPFEISGSAGGAETKKKEKKEGEVETPAQSTEPPAVDPKSGPLMMPTSDKEKRDQQARGGAAPPPKKNDDDDRPSHRK